MLASRYRDVLFRLNNKLNSRMNVTKQYEEITIEK